MGRAERSGQTACQRCKTGSSDAGSSYCANCAAGKEFNLTLDIEVVQMVTSRLERERRVGVCTATFHVTPKSQHRKRKHWQKIQKRQKELEARDAEQA